jgi:hypothetical protein
MKENSIRLGELLQINKKNEYYSWENKRNEIYHSYLEHFIKIQGIILILGVHLQVLQDIK